MGGAQDVAGKLREKTQHDAYSLGPGEGDPRWVMGELDTIKATAAQTGGLFGLTLHVHKHEDEACYVLEGEVTFFVGDDVISASTGTWVYLPRGIPHSLRIESSEARTLWLIVPGGFESFFVERGFREVEGEEQVSAHPRNGGSGCEIPSHDPWTPTRPELIGTEVEDKGGNDGNIDVPWHGEPSAAYRARDRGHGGSDRHLAPARRWRPAAHQYT